MSKNPSDYWCIAYWKGAEKVTEEECSRCTIRGHCGCCCGLYNEEEDKMHEQLEYTKRCANCAWFAVYDGTCFHNPRKQPRPTEASNLACDNYKPIMCEQYNKRAENFSEEEWDNCPHAGDSSAACNL